MTVATRPATSTVAHQFSMRRRQCEPARTAARIPTMPLIQPGGVVAPSHPPRRSRSASPLAVALSPGGHGSTLLRPIPSSTERHPSLGSLAGGQHDRDAATEASAGDDEPPSASEATSGHGVASFQHVSVMLDECVELLADAELSDEAANGPRRYLDATLGAGGHTEALLRRDPDAVVIGLDQDQAALDAARERLSAFGDRVEFHRLRFDRLSEVVDPGSLTGVLFDLGVSSPQLDHAHRGFSFRRNGPLDMRMDGDGAVTAADLVNGLPERELADLLRRHADERQARRIAAAIVAARPVEDTETLARVVEEALPAAVRRTTRQPAVKTFQALRIAVNDELAILEPALRAAIDALAVGGRLVVLSYHSGEDRIVKQVLRGESRVPTGRPDLPPPTGVSARLALLFNGSRQPSDDELARNSRAGSARLRAAVRLGGAS